MQLRCTEHVPTQQVKAQHKLVLLLKGCADTDAVTMPGSLCNSWQDTSQKHIMQAAASHTMNRRPSIYLVAIGICILTFMFCNICCCYSFTGSKSFVRRVARYLMFQLRSHKCRSFARLNMQRLCTNIQVHTLLQPCNLMTAVLVSCAFIGTPRGVYTCP